MYLKYLSLGFVGKIHEFSSDEDNSFSPRSSAPGNDDSAMSNEAEVPPSETTAEQDSELITPVEIAESEGEIGLNLQSDVPVDTIVTTRANKDHPVDNIIGDPNAGVKLLTGQGLGF